MQDYFTTPETAQNFFNTIERLLAPRGKAFIWVDVPQSQEEIQSSDKKAQKKIQDLLKRKLRVQIAFLQKFLEAS